MRSSSPRRRRPDLGPHRSSPVKRGRGTMRSMVEGATALRRCEADHGALTPVAAPSTASAGPPPPLARERIATARSSPTHRPINSDLCTHPKPMVDSPHLSERGMSTGHRGRVRAMDGPPSVGCRAGGRFSGRGSHQKTDRDGRDGSPTPACRITGFSAKVPPAPHLAAKQDGSVPRRLSRPGAWARPEG